MKVLIHCRFCHQDEEHDPGEEFEEYLACAVCGDNGLFRLSFVLYAFASFPHLSLPAAIFVYGSERFLDGLESWDFREDLRSIVQRVEKGKKRRGRIMKYMFEVQGPSADTLVPAAHRQCARDAGSLVADEGTSDWIGPPPAEHTKHLN